MSPYQQDGFLPDGSNFWDNVQQKRLHASLCTYGQILAVAKAGKSHSKDHVRQKLPFLIWFRAETAGDQGTKKLMATDYIRPVNTGIFDILRNGLNAHKAMHIPRHLEA